MSEEKKKEKTKIQKMVKPIPRKEPLLEIKIAPRREPQAEKPKKKVDK